MKNKIKKQPKKNPDLYTREDGVLVGVGHVVVGGLKGYKQVGKKAKGKLVVIEPEPFCKTCDNTPCEDYKSKATDADVKKRIRRSLARC